MAASESSMPSSMLTSRILAPLSTCWRATSSAAAIVVGLDQLAEFGRAGDVGALADNDEILRRVAQYHALTHARRARGRRAASCARPPASRRGVIFRDGFGDGAICSGVVPQQPPTMLTSPSRAHSSEQPGHVLRRLVIFAHGVGQAGIGIDADQRIGDLRDFGDRRPQLLGAERAVQARPRTAADAASNTRRPRRLAGEIAAGQIGDGAGDHDRQLTPISSNTCSTAKTAALAFSVSKMVSIRMSVGAALDQAARLLAIGLDQLVEADIAEAGIVHIGRDRGGAVGRAERAGDEARLVRRLRGPDVGGLARELRRLDVHLVGHRPPGRNRPARSLRIEGVGLEDVGAGFEIGVVDLADDLGLASAPGDRCCP